MNRESLKESYLIGINPWLIGGILVLLICLVPFGYFPSLEYVEWYWQDTVPLLYGLLWTWYYRQFTFNTHWLDTEFLMFAFPTVIFNIIYLLVILGFYQGKISLRNTLLTGISSVLIPLLVLVATNDLFMESGAYVGPLPILFFLSLILFNRVPGPERVFENQSDQSH